MATNGGSVRCAGAMLGQHRHICAFFNSFDEQHRVLRSFIKEGFERGDRQDHLKRLVEAGIDVEQAMGSGQLELRRWQDAYLRDDRFDQDAMLALLEEVLQSGAASGYPLTRFVSRVETALVDKAGVDSWLEYETRVNYVVPKYDDPGEIGIALAGIGPGESQIFCPRHRMHIGDIPLLPAAYLDAERVDQHEM